MSQPNFPTRLDRRTTPSLVSASPSEMMSDADATIWALLIMPPVASAMSPLSAAAVVPMLAARFSKRLLASSSAAPSPRKSQAAWAARCTPASANETPPMAAPTLSALPTSPSSDAPNC